jgi:hypothetical protein
MELPDGFPESLIGNILIVELCLAFFLPGPITNGQFSFWKGCEGGGSGDLGLEAHCYSLGTQLGNTVECTIQLN